MAHALRVARSSGVVLFSYMAQPDFRRYTADRRDAAGQPPRTSKPHSGDPKGGGAFFRSSINLRAPRRAALVIASQCFVSPRPAGRGGLSIACLSAISFGTRERLGLFESLLAIELV